MEALKLAPTVPMAPVPTVRQQYEDIARTIFTGYSQDIYSYHASAPRNYTARDNNTIRDAPKGYGIGFEIEKDAFPSFNFSKEALYRRGHVIQRDGSINGFELATAAYNLYSNVLDRECKYIFKPFCNVTANRNCGGHIALSRHGLSAREMWEEIQGWMPLLYAMYSRRTTGDYSTARKTSDIANYNNKFNSVHLHNDKKYVEIRIFRAVVNYSSLMFRIRLLRELCRHPHISERDAIRMTLDPSTTLHRILTKGPYKDEEKYDAFAKRLEEMQQRFGASTLSASDKEQYKELIILKKESKNKTCV